MQQIAKTERTVGTFLEREAIRAHGIIELIQAPIGITKLVLHPETALRVAGKRLQNLQASQVISLHQQGETEVVPHIHPCRRVELDESTQQPFRRFPVSLLNRLIRSPSDCINSVLHVQH